MSDTQTRTEIRNLLESGLKTEVEPRADDDATRQPITDKLRAASRLEDKLAIAGFTPKPVQHEGNEEACESCMYFAVRRQHCDLPELELPVEPQWSCRLWRI